MDLPPALLPSLAAPLAALALAAAAPRLRAPAGWAALLLGGHWAALALTRCGTTVTYQHLRPDLDAPHELAALGVLALQVAAVALGVARRRLAAAALLRGVGPWRVAFGLALLLPLSAKIARPPLGFALEAAASWALHAVALANAALLAASLAPSLLARLEASGERLLGRPAARDGPEPGGPDRFAWALAAFAALSAAFLAFAVYERHPHVPDEVVYLLHARYLADGRLWLQAPPVPAAFDVDLMLLAGERWYCPVPLGWPLALAVGAFLGAPFLVNPVLNGACVLLAYAFVRELAARRTARLVALLLAASPWFLFLGMSLMTHAWSLACTLLAALGVARSRRTGNLGWAWGAGAAVGMVSLIRPLEGLVLALLLGLWSLGLGGARLRPAAIAGLVLGALLVGGITLPYNAQMTGSAALFPIVHYGDVLYGPGANAMGFGPDRGMGWSGLDPWPGHTPLQALVNAQFNLFATDVELLGWPSGSLWPLVAALLLAPRRREDRLMWAVVAATVLANSLYWFAGGPDFGARYWYPILVPCLWLALSGLRALARHAAPARVGALALALGACGLLVFAPWRALDRYPGYRGMVPDVRALAAEHGFGRSLVLVRGERHPDYASAAAYNPLDWDADAPIYAWDRGGAARRAVLERYRDRPVWILEGPALTGDGFRVAAGPLEAGELLAADR